MNIRDIFRKCKSREFFSFIVIVVVGFGSFGLGMLSVRSPRKSSVTIEEPAGTRVSHDLEEKSHVVNDDEVTQNGGLVIASKSGTRYHFPWCAGAKQISEKNKISFNSAEEARNAGYTPATNCKGLK